MAISTFELLVKPQFPNPSSLVGAPPIKPPLPTELADLSRTVIAAYFLTISNLDAFEANVGVTFTAKLTSPSTFENFLDAVDMTGGSTNLIGKPSVIPVIPPVQGITKAAINFRLPALDTALIVVQPDFINHPEFLTEANFEARGFVEVLGIGGTGKGQLLVTAQTRGTFFKKLTDSAAAIDFGLDQIAYNIPVSNNGFVPYSPILFPKLEEALMK